MATEYARAEPSNLSKEQIFGLAESVAGQLDFKPGGNIQDAVARLGGEVAVHDTILEDPEHTGSLFVDRPQQFRVVIPSHTSPQRDRFTIAHELGHYIVHYLYMNQGKPDAEPMMAMRRDSHRVEWEANWFAAAFLMPKDVFTEKFHQLGGNLDLIASDFGVSKAAADVRAKSLGLID